MTSSQTRKAMVKASHNSALINRDHPGLEVGRGYLQKRTP